MINLLELQPIKQFVESIGKDVEQYFGKDDACIIYLRPDGVFYGQGLYQWLSRKKKNLILTTMEDDGSDLQEEKVRNRKVLLVDNDIVTGKGYKRAIGTLRLRKKELQIKGIKFATFSDRVGLADFYVGTYSPEAIWYLEELDAVDLKIIQFLAQNGRESFAEIAKKLRLSSVAVKNRVDKLLKEKIIRIQGTLQIDQFYTISAQIQIEADAETAEQLIGKLEKCQEVYHLAKMIGHYNLVVGFLAHNLENIEELVDKEIRVMPGVKQIVISMGEIPILPKTIPLQF